jgi:RNA polymerase sigma factor (sigma-70 family)
MELQREEQLLRIVKNGDMRAFEELYLETRPVAVNIARRLVGSQEAEDIVQDSYVRALRAISNFRGECRFGTWLCRIIYTQAADWKRKRTFVTGQEFELDQLACKTNNINADIDLFRGLQSLRRERERSLLACHLEGYSNSEIASKYGLTISALKSRLCRIRRELRVTMSAVQ